MLTEAMWERLSPLLPPQKPRTGRPSLDHRRFLEAVLWLARTGALWRNLPAELMNWRTAWRRLQRWTAAGIWERNLVERLVGKLKRFRRVATRYDKLAPHYLAFVRLAAVVVWLRSLGRV